MEDAPTPQPENNMAKLPWGTVRTVVYIVAALILFLFALDLMISSFQHLGKGAAETIILATSNPFTALFIGLLITAMIQSSSTTSSMVVALVASGSITIESAVPIIMGANIGTTITSTIVSLGFINKKKEFRRAVSAGTYHDFFNILTVIILFPLEYYYGFLSSLSTYIAHSFFPGGSTPMENTVRHFWPGFNPIINFLVSSISNGFLLAILSFALLFASIIVFRRLISNLMLVNSPERFGRFFFKNQFKSFAWGLITTAAIRSSTITTSLVVPLVAKKITSLRKAAPFILGANMGTTITAFIAATLNSNTTSAISIAIAHFLFNFLGVLLFLPIPVLRKVPIELAEGLGKLTLKYRLVGFVYLLSTFFFIPFSLIYLNQSSIETLEVTYVKKNTVNGDTATYRIISKMNETSQSGEWMTFPPGSTDSQPSEIFPVYRKNNILIVNKEMYLFNRPGFCWDGENRQGTYQSCIREIMSTMTLATGEKFDSVYVYDRRYHTAADSVVERLYVSPLLPIFLKRQLIAPGDRVIESEEVSEFTRK